MDRCLGIAGFRSAHLRGGAMKRIAWRLALVAIAALMVGELLLIGGWV
jgi:hypothetical protein